MVKLFFRAGLAFVLVTAFSSCVYEQAVFTEGAVAGGSDLQGLWVHQEDSDDPRESEYALLLPFTKDSSLLHCPVDPKEGLYYRAQQYAVREETILQLEWLGQADGTLRGKDKKGHTLVWLKKIDEERLLVRPLDLEVVKQFPTADALRSAIGKADTDWEKLFAPGAEYRKLK